MADVAKLVKELGNITHEFNNILNTLNGYTELALDAKNSNNEEEYNFFKEKVFATVHKKLTSAKELTERLNKLQVELAENA